MNPPESDLNLEQKKAVTFTDGPLLIIAGAGTGKTKGGIPQSTTEHNSGKVCLYSEFFGPQTPGRSHG